MANNFLNMMNNLSIKSNYKKISELEEFKKYEIINAVFKETKFGKSIQITIQDNTKLFLPKRYCNIKKEELKSFVGICIQYEGKKDKMDIISFHELDEESDDEEEQLIQEQLK